MTDTDTTPTEGVSDGAEEPIETTVIVDKLNPGRKGIDDIISKARAGRDARREEEGDTGTMVTGDDAPAAKEPAEPPETPASADPPDRPEPSAPSEQMITVVQMDGSELQVPASSVKLPVKINGEDRMVTAAEGIRGAQMVGAGQENLRKATIRLREAERLERDAQTRATVKPQAPAEEKPGDTPDADKDADRIEIAHAIQYGSEEEIAEALRKLQGRDTSGATPDEDLIKKAVAEGFDAQRRYDAEVHSAEAYRGDLNTFGDEFKDVLEDENTRRITANYTHAARAASLNHYLGYDVANMRPEEIKATFDRESASGALPLSNLDVLRIAGQATRDWTDTMVQGRSSVGPTPTVSESDFKAKRARKAAAPTPPAGATATPPAQHVPQRKTTSEKIAEMKQARKGRVNPRLAHMVQQR